MYINFDAPSLAGDIADKAVEFGADLLLSEKFRDMLQIVLQNHFDPPRDRFATFVFGGPAETPSQNLWAIRNKVGPKACNVFNHLQTKEFFSIVSPNLNQQLQMQCSSPHFSQVGTNGERDEGTSGPSHVQQKTAKNCTFQTNEWHKNAVNARLQEITQLQEKRAAVKKAQLERKTQSWAAISRDLARILSSVNASSFVLFLVWLVSLSVLILLRNLTNLPKKVQLQKWGASRCGKFLCFRNPCVRSKRNRIQANRF